MYVILIMQSHIRAHQQACPIDIRIYFICLYLLCIPKVKLKMINQNRQSFGRFLRQFGTDFLEILQRSFSIQILTAVNISQNYIWYFKR